MRRLLRLPALHFVVLGAALYAASRAWSPPAAPAVSLADEELIYREALALGIDRRDPLVRDRLAKLGAFLAADGMVGEPEDGARTLGLVGRDAVIRRHLVQVMRLALSAPTPADRPTDADVDAWLATHPERFATPTTVDLTHVYLARGRHDGDAAERARARLRAGAPVAGDAFLHGSHVEAVTADGLDRLFGPGFAAAIAGAPVGTWVGPVPSTYGVHLVRVDARRAGGPSDERRRSPTVRRQAALALVAERRAARLDERLAVLRGR